MRILHVNNEKGWRGGERQTLLTAAEQRRQGVDASIACRRGSDLARMSRENGVPILELPASPAGTILHLRKAIPAFDLIHCHSGRAHSLAALAMLGRPKPLVISRRVDFVPRNSWFNRWKFRRCAKVVCVSHWIARLLEDWGLEKERIAVVYEAVPGDTCLSPEASRKLLAGKAGFREGQKLVGNIAALVPHKDQETLLRAARFVADHRPDVAFVIVGEGLLQQQLLDLRQSLGLAETVHFTGFIPQAQRLLPAFDVLAMSSCMEGLGTTVLDAGMAEIPVAATAGGGLPEIVLNEKTGLLVPVKDARALAEAILRLLSDGPLAKQLASNARHRLETDFTVSAMARRYVDIYRTVLKNPPQKDS
jgi:glycosyltransferase involved in cell wall biosynthesis